MGEFYEIGYKKPPRHTRFPQGTSGNSKGRPRGKRNLATVLKEILQEKVVIIDHGVRRTVTKLEASVIKLVDQARSGDTTALKLVAALLRSVEDRTVEPPPQDLSQDDLKIIQRVFERQSKCLEGDSNDDR